MPPVSDPALVVLLAELDRARHALDAAVAAVPDDRRERAPADGSWSIAQVVEHLALLDDGMTSLFAKRVARGREKGVGPSPGLPDPLGRLQYAVDRAASRIDAPPFLRPGAVAFAAAGAHADRARRALRDAIAAGDGLDYAQLFAAHPYFGDFDLYQWVLFIARHEQRHTAQVTAIAEALT
jgi:uncharacterized damage-inducible protein DinB